MNAAREVINLLVFIQLLDLARFHIASPQYVPLAAAVQQLKTAVLEWVHKNVVYVGWVADLKGQEQLLHFLNVVHSKSIARVSGELTVPRVREESGWWPLVEHWFQEIHVSRVRPEHTIGEATLMLPHECQSHGILKQKFIHFLRSCKLVLYQELKSLLCKLHLHLLLTLILILYHLQLLFLFIIIGGIASFFVVI